MSEIKQKKQEEIFFRGEKTTRYTQDDGQIEWSDLWFNNKHDQMIGRTSLSPLDRTQVINIREEKHIQNLLAFVGISRNFLMAVPNDPTPEIIVYTIVRPEPENCADKKIRRIVLWSEKNKEFDVSFVFQLWCLRKKGHELSVGQKKALDNIIEKWKIP